jgi:hypothetical protein
VAAILAVVLDQLEVLMISDLLHPDERHHHLLLSCGD